LNLNLTRPSTLNVPQSLSSVGFKPSTALTQTRNLPSNASSVAFGASAGMFDGMERMFKIIGIALCLTGAAVGVGATLLVKGCTSSAPTQQMAPPQTDAEKIKDLQEQVKKLQEAKSSETDKK
jgi:outer membrane murein-binding lipoprotein Lpp